MFQKALVGLWATCVCATLSGTGAFAAATDIVMDASDATNIRGNWSRVADATAAGGQTLSSVDRAWANTSGPLASPADSFDVTFTAPAATAYHVWLRMRATANSKYNDSVFTQFSDAVDSGGASVFGLGTTTGVTVNLAGDITGTGLSGWGWQDGGYWLSQATTIRFATSGTHTLRIQTREDGASVGQIVLSPVTYLTAAPGPIRNDVTMPSLPAPWVTRSIGTGLIGAAAHANGVFTVAGSGADMWGAADDFQLVSQLVSADAQIVAKVSSIQNTNEYAKAGVILRETAAVDAAHVLLAVRPNGSIEFMSRPASGAATMFLAGATQAAPAWLKLARSGATVTGSVSSNGTTWTVVGTTSVTMAGSASMGLAVTSHDPALLNTATFDAVTVTVPPAAPGSPAPGHNFGDVATAALTWSAAGATSHDVSFGTTNPPALVASGVANASYLPAGVMAGTTYYWQVVARNAAGSTPGPIWSFTTVAPPPATPSSPMPGFGATSVALNTALTWHAPGAARYDLSFGTTNPPGIAAANLSSASFAPAGLTNRTTYYWQVVARNAGGTTAGPVWSFTTVAARPAVPANVVLYAGDASAMRGNWAIVSDATAAGGQTLTSTDRAWANIAAPLASPPDFVDFTFTAHSATPYHVWLRMRAAGNSKYNDSVYVQFSDALDETGATVHALGTANGLSVNLAIDSTARNLTGWGWQDGVYWLHQATTIEFAADGAHTLRIQTREDGASIDQIVLSPVTYLTTAPGLPANDTTIVPKSSATPAPTVSPATLTGAPSAYAAVVDRIAHAKPAVPMLGPAGFAFTDPTFGARMLRVTDGFTRPNATGRSYSTPSAAHQTAWNTNSTFFYLRSTDGTFLPFAFDASTMTASRILPGGSGNGGLTITSQAEPQFSFLSPSVLFTTRQDGANDWPVLRQFDFSTGTYADILNVGTIASVDTHSYTGNIASSAGPAEKVAISFGGSAQDQHYLTAVLRLAAPVTTVALLNTIASTLTVNGVTLPTNIPLNFRLHHMWMDKSGRYVILETTGADRSGSRKAAPLYVWDTETQTFTELGSPTLSGGHFSTGYGALINQDCCISSAWDAAQWQLRSLSAPGVSADIVTNTLSPKQIYLGEHNSWNNAQSGASVPMVAGLFRYGANTAAWRAWDDEIVAVQTSAADTTANSVVWRFAHHRTNVASDVDPSALSFWYTPRPNVSQDGRWVIFTSNWEKTLGVDPYGQNGATYRQDVFIIALTPQP